MQRPVLAVAASVAVLGLASAAPAQSAPGSVVLSATPERVQVVGLPCLPGAFKAGMTNTGSTDLYADMELTAHAPVVLDRQIISSWLPAKNPDQTVTTPVGVTVPRSTKPGNYEVNLRSGRSKLTVPVEVLPLPPKGDGVNLALGEQASASSTHGSFRTCGAVDGDADSANWSTSTGWNDATRGVFPDDYTVTMPAAVLVGRVELQSLDSVTHPAARNALRDWDVQVRSAGSWATVASVRGNVAGKVSSSFPATTGDAVRIVALDSNDHAYSRIVELGVYSR